jgi:hypothetical protein
MRYDRGRTGRRERARERPGRHENETGNAYLAVAVKRRPVSLYRRPEPQKRGGWMDGRERERESVCVCVCVCVWKRMPCPFGGQCCGRVAAGELRRHGGHGGGERGRRADWHRARLGEWAARERLTRMPVAGCRKWTGVGAAEKAGRPNGGGQQRDGHGRAASRGTSGERGRRPAHRAATGQGPTFLCPGRGGAQSRHSP